MDRPVITYSKNVFLPLTTVCHNRCGYCIFRTPVHEGCILDPAEANEILTRGAALGCTEALFTFGERPGLEMGFPEMLSRYGYHDILDYCYDLCETAIDHGILPHTNGGILTTAEMERLREVNASMGLMLETTANLAAHQFSPGKDPVVRIAMIEDAGHLKIPFTTGILIGIGETMEDREESLLVIRDLHRRYGHIQEVIIQNFCPKEGTPMAAGKGVDSDEMCTVIKMAKDILPDDIAVQIPPNLANAGKLIPCGIDDLGGISPLTIDYVNPEHPWPEFERLVEIAGDRILRERLCIYPHFIKKKWFHPRLEPLIMRLDQHIRRKERT
ncbi:MAG TPA: 7,8-didemethyl-8-hydroxy-5-deazariboflavin synthase subunit CofG [Methanoregulaceae archaeon]|mgnify:CR=1 FL=1|nr:MAG: 7,8-didemethyl-8-hydroxy-5-deazariboflavin synthase subunit CofG [Methanolinea sp.]HON81196.1 7,8-didemethyl-8-hydroxy-5-deazariboflavin synthase subunit CofG [Methanoregulaceae archaeon]HPD09860.1 7,8-didemethyl-8-hydroxy-5-deazariboflavin synthase subunit CofG [Methanoregulaceae archaeon]HRT14949.1 7,8-didemethyl-8-hydroxy-5-deazariboflavin synthase subunit CofG [Methanoregulaceae archaeon]HRU30436.1 7,8-didemethyl-8-hydroxy-5-deazariboflavin synthase subunit CofG [Methanoregulaceae a